MSKTPYEIRLELLKLANEILVTPVFNNRESLREEYHSKLTDENRGTMTYPVMPDFPSSKDIVAKAEELNKFISQQ